MAIVYVNLDADGANDGSSWNDAYNSLQDALSNAEKGDEIWIAEGTYKPTESRNRNAAFRLKESVNIYGGFAGNENSLDERNILANETILSGNINDEDETDDNSYSVVEANDLDEETRLDGLTIQEGFGVNVDDVDGDTLSNSGVGAGIMVDNSQLILSNLTVTDNQAQYGGGIAVSGEDSEVSLINNRIVNNSASVAGGGVVASLTAIDLVNNLLVDNVATSVGGGMYSWRSTVNIVNNTFSNNFSEEQGSAITVENGSVLELSNSIVWGNSSTEEGEQVYTKNEVENFEESTATVSYTLVEEGFSGENNLEDDPEFVDLENGDYRLNSDSPALDVGDNDLVNVDVDLDGNSRIINEIVDLGAYEFSSTANEIRGTDGDDSLVGGSDNDLILGFEGRDTLTGGGGNDTIDGGPSNNFLSGGPGNDSLTGGSARDLLRGGLGDDTLNGDTANDILSGDGGNDVIIGGEGSDRFEFNSPEEGTDTITDFESGNDLISISVEGFGGELETGSLSSAQFILGSSASTSEQRFIYNQDQGDLFFDVDGSGEAEEIKIAVLSDSPSLSHRDFFLF